MIKVWIQDFRDGWRDAGRVHRGYTLAFKAFAILVWVVMPLLRFRHWQTFFTFGTGIVVAGPTRPRWKRKKSDRYLEGSS